jgi:hypothetical protein
VKRLAATAIAFCLLALSTFSTNAQAQKHKGVHSTTKGRGAAKGKSTAKKSCAKDIAHCPAQGCGGDPLLNGAKNRVTAPAVAQVVDMTLDDIRNTAQPDSWQAGRDRAELQGAKREGQPVRVMGFLWKAKREHAESCNCGLDASGKAGELITDIHMVLTDKPDDPEATSVTAEVTPRVRARRPNPVTWTASSIKPLQGKFIRVTGYMMLDTEHLIHNALVRATNWEVHPITKLEVCTMSQAQCEAGQGWRNVP